MKFPRAILLMLTGLAGGVGGRLAFTSPEGNNARRGGRAGEGAVRQANEGAAKTERAGPRPEEASVLAARGGSRLRLLMAWLPGAGEEEILRMAAALTGPKQDENLSIRLLMARWAEVNPAAMLSWARTQTDSYGGGFYTSNAIEAWARVDFDKAWATACTELPQTRGAALLGLTVADPGKCLGILRANPSFLDGSHPYNGDPFSNSGSFAPMEKVIARLAARDPAATAALLDGGPASRLHRFAGDVALKWAKSDPAGAVAWMQSLDPGVRAASLEEAAKWIAGHAPEQLPALLESLPAGRIRSMAAAEGFSRLASTDPAAARRQLEAMPASPSRQFCRGLLMKELLQGGDEAGAIALASQLGWQLDTAWCPATQQIVMTGGGSTSHNSDDGSNEISLALQELMGRIAARDPQQAAALIVQSKTDVSELLTEENVTNHAALAAAFLVPGDEDAARNCQSVVNFWSDSDPAAAAAWVTAHFPSGGDRSNIMGNVFMKWLVDPPAMLQWAATVDADTVRAAWMQLVSYNEEYTTAHVEEFAATADAAAYETLMTSGNYANDAASRILKLMPDDMDVDVSRPMESWLTEKPEEATKWVRDLPPGARRTNATEAIVMHLNDESDHEGAFAWAVTLPEEKREDFLINTLDFWQHEDPDAAEAAIRASALPPEEQQSLLDSLLNSLPPPK